jgi:hypothetical protein
MPVFGFDSKKNSNFRIDSEEGIDESNSNSGVDDVVMVNSYKSDLSENDCDEWNSLNERLQQKE